MLRKDIKQEPGMKACSTISLLKHRKR